jgi:hypothetical protein
MPLCQETSTLVSSARGNGATAATLSLAVRVRLAPVLPRPPLLSLHKRDPRMHPRRRTRLPLHHHPRPRPLILHRWTHRRSQFLGGLEGPVNVPKDLPREKDYVGITTQEDVLGLMRFGDDAHGADEDVLDVLLDVCGKVDLCGTYQRGSSLTRYVWCDVRYDGPTTICPRRSLPPDDTSMRSIPRSASF